jgi:hypothetical protein
VLAWSVKRPVGFPEANFSPTKNTASALGQWQTPRWWRAADPSAEHSKTACLRHRNKIVTVALRPLVRSSVMTGIFQRLRHSQFAHPIWQPVFFAILLLLISVTLVLIITT